jgi:chromosome segregation protein
VVVGGSGERITSNGPGVAVSRALAKGTLEAAARAAAATAERAIEAAETLHAARAARERAWTSALGAARAADQADQLVEVAIAERARIETEASRLRSTLDSARAEREALEEAAQIEVNRLAAAQRSLAELEEGSRVAAERDGARRAGEARLEARRSEVVAQGSAIELRGAELNERQRLLRDRLDEVERRLSGRAEEREEAAGRRRMLERNGVALERLARIVEHQRARLEGALDTLQEDYHHQVEAVRIGSERLETLRNQRSETEVRLGEVRDRVRTLDLEAAEAALRVESLVEMTQRDLGRDPGELVGSQCPELPEGVSAAAHARALADQLDAMGPVNPLALEELSVLEDRHRELDTQVADIRSARRELQEVIESLNDEIVQTFTAAAADVNEHFSALIDSLFPGGIGRLILTEPDDLLNTGVEIEVRPAGRNIRRVSLLSGGERSLAALAFLFAVFRSRPSPFYLMDEVEAALDDVNLSRFLGLVKEFRDEAQLIVISHQKRTMETGDALYGVTMAPGGSSQVISQRVEREVGIAS